MKFITLCILFISLNKNCSSQSQNDLKNTAVEYTASTRGFHMKISVKNQMLSISKDRNDKELPVETKISDADWQELIGLLKNIDLKTISTLKAPTEKRYYDGAAIGNLKITHRNQEYESNSFDHGSPPKEIKTIVDKINSFAKKKE